MGLIKATTGAIRGALADQWRDFLTIPAGIEPTAALFPAVSEGTNRNRGSNTKASEGIITNGSKIVVPEGYGLLLFQDAKLTAFVAEPGAYIWDSTDIESESLFAGQTPRATLIDQSWHRFKYGGRPSSQQLALFVSLKELPGNKFGTQTTIYWDDAYFNAQAGAIAHGAYSLRIVDPIVFAAQFVPASYLQAQRVFDFTDGGNPASKQLFSEIVGSLAAAFSRYTNGQAAERRITHIQSDAVGFAQSLSEVIEEGYRWRETRGLEITQVAIAGIEYDQATQELLRTVQRADALAGSRGNVNLQASVAAGIEAAGENGGSEGVLGVGIASGSVGLGSLMQPEGQSDSQVSREAGDSDLVQRLGELRAALDAGLISEADYDAAKAKALGLD